VVDESGWLANEFEGHRSHLPAVAYRMLGSASEADDAVQEAWLRLSRSDVSDVQNLAGWLTMVVGRVCLDMLRTRKPAARNRSTGAHPARPGSSWIRTTQNRRHCSPSRSVLRCSWCSTC
jgi:DNA-directed RNA polymerase specialized sigma24 family protein